MCNINCVRSIIFLVILTGCLGNTKARQVVVIDSLPANLEISPEFIDRLKNNTVIVETKDGVGGSAFVINWEFKSSKGKKVFITANHVVRGVPIGDSVLLRYRINLGGNLEDILTTSGELVLTDSVNDLAVIVSRDVMDIFKSPFDIHKGGAPGDVVFAVGYPGDVFPAIVSAGYVRSNGERIYHTATIWYGNSGGPLVDCNGRVIGVNIAMTGLLRIMGDRAIATKAEKLISLLGKGV